VVFWEQGNGYVKIECDIDDRGPEGDVLTQAVDELLAALGVRRYAPPAPKPELPSLDAPKDAWFDWYHRVKDLGYKITLRDLADEWGYGYDYVRQMHAEYQGEHKEIGSTDNTH